MTSELLREILHYDPETGYFRWKVATSRAIKTGAIAGCADGEGYLEIGIFRRKYLTHRLAWLYQTGSWPEGEIDHVNGIRNDNRFVNLRPATRSQNQQNTRRQINNTSGFKGVSWFEPTRRWKAYINLRRKQIHLGYFDTPEEAHAAYCAASEALHREFGRTA